MTENEKKLADVCGNIRRRADDYAMLLFEVVREIEQWRDDVDMCPFCGDPAWYDQSHTDDCVIARIKRQVGA